MFESKSSVLKFWGWEGKERIQQDFKSVSLHSHKLSPWTKWQHEGNSCWNVGLKRSNPSMTTVATQQENSSETNSASSSLGRGVCKSMLNLTPVMTYHRSSFKWWTSSCAFVKIKCWIFCWIFKLDPLSLPCWVNTFSAVQMAVN